jgi:hypothetical protein
VNSAAQISYSLNGGGIHRNGPRYLANTSTAKLPGFMALSFFGPSLAAYSAAG